MRAYTSLLRSRVAVSANLLTQRLEAAGIARSVARVLLPTRMRWRTPRAPGSLPSDVAFRARPINFPQRGRGHIVLHSREIDQSLLRTVHRLRRHESVDIIWDPTTPARAADALVSMAAAGVPLRVPHGHTETGTLDADLANELARPRTPGDHARELRSIRIRRRGHDLIYNEDRDSQCPEVSVLLATMRPSDLPRAVRQVYAQHGCRLQLLIGLHGDAWPGGVEADLADMWPRRTSVVRFASDVPLGKVLADLSECAEAPLVTKWDDDDLYGRDHVADLIRAYRYSGADIVGKAAEFVYVESAGETIRRFSAGAESYSWTLAGGTMLMSRSWLSDVGGWPHVRSSVDHALIQVGRRSGSTPYRTHGFQYLLVRRAGGDHTWTAGDQHFLAGASGRRRGLDVGFADISADMALDP